MKPENAPETGGWWSGPLTTGDERRAADALYQRTFDYRAPEFRLNPYLLAALHKGGGSVIGVKDPTGELVGFAYGFHAVDEQGDYHYSQAAVVAPGSQGQGIGARLKQAQRDHVAARTGVGRMRWSFPPALARNAHFNLAKLGAAAIAYDPDYYDQPGSERLVVEWVFAGDGHVAARAAAAGLAGRLAARPGTVEAIAEPDIPGASWIVFPAAPDDVAKAALGSALAERFAEGSILCWSGRVNADAAAYLAVPRMEAADAV